MKYLVRLIALCLAVICYSCDQGEKEFVIKGSTTQDRLNGVQVFIVPCDPKAALFSSKAYEDSIGVDSVYIKDNKFEFRGKGEYLARITIDRHSRFGTQDLLVVTEPGMTAEIVIDSISHGGGTPQNEALQQWKSRLEAYNRIAGPATQEIFRLRQLGDTVRAKEISDTLKIYNEKLTEDIVGIAKVLGQGTAYDVLMHRYGR